MKQTTKKLSTFEVLAYGLTTATGLGNMLCMTYLSSFWTDVIGISSATVATILLMARLLDGVSDIIMGNVLDRTHTRFGQAKPWLFVGAIGILVTSIALFAVPSIGMNGKIAYSAIFYILLSVVFGTMASIACASLNNLITPDTNDRVRLGAVYFVFYFVLTIVISFGLMFVEPLGGGQGGWIKLCVIAGLISLVLLFVAWKGITERVQHNTSGQKEKFTVKDIAYALTHNKYFFCTMGIYLCINVYNAMVLGVGVYYAMHVMNSVAAFTTMTVASYLPCIIGTAVTPKLEKIFGMSRVVLAGNILTVVAYGLIVVNPRNLIWVCICLAVGGFGSGAISANIGPFCAMSADYGEYKTGKAMPGIYSGGASFGTKVGSAVGAAIYGFILAAAGYNGLAETQTAAAQNAIIGCYAIAPAVFTVFIILLSMPMKKLEQNFGKITEALERRRAGEENR